MPATSVMARSRYHPKVYSVLNPGNLPNGHTSNCKLVGVSVICLYYAGYIAPNWLPEATIPSFYSGNQKYIRRAFDPATIRQLSYLG